MIRTRGCSIVWPMRDHCTLALPHLQSSILEVQLERFVEVLGWSPQNNLRTKSLLDKASWIINSFTGDSALRCWNNWKVLSKHKQCYCFDTTPNNFRHQACSSIRCIDIYLYHYLFTFSCFCDRHFNPRQLNRGNQSIVPVVLQLNVIILDLLFFGDLISVKREGVNDHKSWQKWRKTDRWNEWTTFGTFHDINFLHSRNRSKLLSYQWENCFDILWKCKTACHAGPNVFLWPTSELGIVVFFFVATFKLKWNATRRKF